MAAIPRRRALRFGLAALAVIAVAIVVAPRIWPGHGHHGASTQAPRRGVPRFLVAVRAGVGGATLSRTLAVIDTRTGKVTGQYYRPARRQFFTAVAPLGSDRVFVAEAAGDRCYTWFYRFRLTPRGRPVGLTPLAVHRVPGYPLSPPALAAGAKGLMLAFATRNCRAATQPGSYGQAGVIDLVSRKVTTWTIQWPVAPTSLSLSADGRLLGMVSDPGTGPGYGSDANYESWVLRTGAQAGPLAGRYRVVSGPQPQCDQRAAARLPRCRRTRAQVPAAAALSPDGTRTWALTPADPQRPVSPVLLRAYRTATGVLIGSWRPFGQARELHYPIFLSPDVSGRYALVEGVAGAGRLQVLDLATRRLSHVPGTAAGAPVDIAW